MSRKIKISYQQPIVDSLNVLPLHRPALKIERNWSIIVDPVCVQPINQIDHDFRRRRNNALDFQPKMGMQVTNERRWHGQVVDRPMNWRKEEKGDYPVFYVFWLERYLMSNGKMKNPHGVKDPVISHLNDGSVWELVGTKKALDLAREVDKGLRENSWRKKNGLI